jgi:hypothetical protein
MAPLQRPELSRYLADCERISVRPTLAGWIAIETQGLEREAATAHETEMAALWGDLDLAF